MHTEGELNRSVIGFKKKKQLKTLGHRIFLGHNFALLLTEKIAICHPLLSTFFSMLHTLTVSLPSYLMHT